MSTPLHISVTTTIVKAAAVITAIVIAYSLPVSAQQRKHNGQECSTNAECFSTSCFQGPGDGDPSYCMAKGKNCAWPGTDGGMKGEQGCFEGEKVECMLPNSHWRFAPTGRG